MGIRKEISSSRVMFTHPFKSRQHNTTLCPTSLPSVPGRWWTENSPNKLDKAVSESIPQWTSQRWVPIRRTIKNRTRHSVVTNPEKMDELRWVPPKVTHIATSASQLHFSPTSRPRDQNQEGWERCTKTRSTSARPETPRIFTLWLSSPLCESVFLLIWQWPHSSYNWRIRLLFKSSPPKRRCQTDFW